MKHVWLWAVLVVAACLWAAAARPRAADPASVPITIAVTGMTNAQLECPH